MGLLNKLFGREKNKQSSLEQPVQEVKKEREGYINLGQSIFPIIKNENDPKIKISQNNNPIITEKLSDGIVVCYILDTGSSFEMISTKHLKNFGLNEKDIKDVAIRNLTNKVNKNCKIGIMDLSDQNPEIKPFYRVEMDSNLNPSMMLIDEFWDNNVKEILKSDTIAVSIPAKNLILFSDLKIMESFRTMRPVANQMFESSVPDGIELSKDTYIRKNGKWVKFLDTPEQMAELW